MIAECTHENRKKSGRNRNLTQRYRCLDCQRYFSDAPPPQPLGNLRIGMERAELVLSLLLESMSIRATERLTGTCRQTICDLVLVAGERCAEFMESTIINVPVTAIECDEIWSKIFWSDRVAKLKGCENDTSRGSSWTFVALEVDTKLVLAYHIGGRNGIATTRFLRKLRRAADVSKPFQITTDGFSSYQYSVPFELGSNTNYAMLIKSYKSPTQEVIRYAPPEIQAIRRVPIFGSPDPRRISTSYVESLNQKIRAQMKRFCRLTAAISKSEAHHEAMQQIFFAHYNFCRKHSTIGTTPAVAAGIMDNTISIRSILEV